MKVFISWSGPQSKPVATALAQAIPEILAGNVTTFISSEDIQKGERGLAVISQELAATDYGVVVLTRSNVAAQWINFESGALGRSLGTSRVSPFLIDLAQKDVTGPLTQFQMTDGPSKTDVHKLLQDINLACERPMPPGAVSTLFDAHWDEILAAVETSMDEADGEAPVRETDDILEEILERVRSFDRIGGSWARPAEERPGIALLTTLIGSGYSRLSSMYSEEQLLRAEVTLEADAPRLTDATLAKISALAVTLGGVIRLTREDDHWIEYAPDGAESRSVTA